MFIRTRLTIATVLAAAIGTAGIVAAATTGSDGTPSTTSTAGIGDAAVATTAIEPPATTTPETASAPSDDAAPATPDTTVAPAQPAITTTTTTITTTMATGELVDPAGTSEPAPQPAPDPADVEEPPAPGEPGVIDGPDPVAPTPPAPEPGSAELLEPVPKPVPPKPAIPGPTDLLPGNGGGDPDPTPHQGPSDFQVTPLPGYLGTISSGLTGCQLECVTRAQLISNDFNPSVVLEIEATVPVHVEAEVTKSGTDSSKHTSKAGYDTEWAIQLSPLQPDTTYDLELIVIDQDGYSKVFEHQFTTVDIIDGLVGNAQGCALHCMTEGTVHKTDQFSKVQLQLASSTPARYDVWVSTSEPGTIGDTPILPLEAKVYENANPSTSATFDVTGLQADTTYHVVARAEDEWGVDHRVGTFHTDAAPPIAVTVTFEHIRLTYDGDKSAVNKGEVAFRWGLDGYATGSRSEEKMHAPKNIPLTSHNSETYLLPADGWVLPWIGVSGLERDWDGLSEFCATGLGIASEHFYSADCDTRTNVARTPGTVSQADVESLHECSLFGLTGEKAAHKCLFLVAPDHGDEYAQFTAIVSIDAP